MKTFLKIFIGIILFLVAIFIGLNLYFTSARLKKMVLPRLQAAIGRPVSIKHISLSLFKTFPNPAIEIDRLSVPGKTKTDTLFSLKQLALGIRLFPLINHRLVITELDIDEPRFTYIVYPDSSTNIDFLYDESQTDTTSSDFAVAIPHFHIHNGYFGYIDSTFNFQFSVGHVSGNLSFSYADSITNQIDVTIGSLNVSQGGENYIKGLPVGLRGKSTLYWNKELLKINKGHFSIHGLKMNLTGDFKNWSLAPRVNLHFKSSSNNFGALLQLLPESYHSYTKGLQTKGSLTLNGTINGKISEEDLPAFDIKMTVRNGYIKDPDLSKPIKDIRFTATATKKLLGIDTLHAVAGKNELSGSGWLKNPLKDSSAFQARFLADVDLSTVHQFYDLSQMDIQKLGGQLKVNASLKGQRSNLKNMNFDGKAIFSNGLIKYKGVPKAFTPINVDIAGSQDLLHIHRFDWHAGQNSLTAQGSIRNLADKSNRRANLDLNLKVNLASLQNYYPIENDSLQLKGVFAANVKLKGDATQIVQSIQSGSLQIKNGAITGTGIAQPVTNLNVNLNLSPSKATLKTLKANIGSSDMNISGSLTHYLSLLKPESERKKVPTLTGHFSSNFLNLDELMSQSSDTSSFYPQLPELNTHLSADVKRLKIAGVIMRKLHVQAETTPTQVHLSDARVRLFNGKASGKMRWKIPDDGPSTFHFEGSLDSLQLKSFFKQYPILGEDSRFYKYISGSFSAQANYTTKIDTTLTPIITTSSLTGSFGMGKARINGHPIQEKLVQFTHINKLNNITLDSWKSYVSIKNKVLTLKNLSITHNDIGMELNGTEQLLTGLIDFHVSLHLPSSLQSSIGSVLNGRISRLLTQPDGSIILPLIITGQYSHPTIKLDKRLIKKRVKKNLKHKAQNTIKNIFNRFRNKNNQKNTTKSRINSNR